MSFKISADPQGQSPQGIWPTLAPYVAPPGAAASAIVFVFYGFVAKTAQQRGSPMPRLTLFAAKNAQQAINPIPHMTVKEAVIGGCKAAPAIGALVGTQMIAQGLIEKHLIKPSENKEKTPPSLTTILTSSVVVGIASTPAAAIFNGQTMKLSAIQSLRGLSAKQTGAIVSREICFLFSMRVSGPVSKAMENYFGENKAVEYASAFFSGAIGSVIGHPADTALTLWQKGMKVETLTQAMRGAPVRAVTIGAFSMSYKMIKELIEPTQK
jgi:hypothetical protein